MRLPRSLQWRIVATYTALIFVTMGVVSIYLIDFIRDSFVSDLEDRLIREASLLSQSTDPYASDLEASKTVDSYAEAVGGHITLLDENGDLIADSHRLPNTYDPEVAEALLGQIVSISRSVEMLNGQEFHYVAAPLGLDSDPAGVIRIGVPTASVTSDVNRIVSTVVVSAILVGALSILLGWYVARRTIRSVLAVTAGARQLASGNLDHRVPALGSDESRDLAIAFNRMARTIRSTVTALEGERSKLSAVLDTMADGVMVADSDGEVNIVNAAAETMLGLPKAAAVGTRLAGAVWDHDLMQLVHAGIATGEPQYGEVVLSSNRRTVSAVATPIKHEGSEGLLLTLHDLTRRRSVDTTRREFVSNVSHELRNPLASIKALVETLQVAAKDDSTKADEFLSGINEEVDRMTSLVAELLELSRLESGRVKLDVEPFQLSPLVTEVLSRFQKSAHSKEIKLDASVSKDLPDLVGERRKIRQVLVNLIDNALRFTPENGKVEVSAEQTNESIMVRVSDSGPGIAPEHLPHVFERFYKVDRSRHEGGTGLGLAIVRHIILAHSGDVSVDSEVGKGAHFTFTLPVA